ncbi:MAG: hypothetical protein AABZ44_05300, partial [Elusimicrobiota bacterium]
MDEPPIGSDAGILLLAVRGGRALKKLSTRTQETMGQLSTTMYEALSGIQIVQAFSMEPHVSGGSPLATPCWKRFSGPGS